MQQEQEQPSSGENEAATVSDRVTAAVRAADKAFQDVGGSTRHYVRECLLPELERAGLIVVQVPEGVKRDSPVTFGQAWDMMPPQYRAHMLAALRYSPEAVARDPLRRALEDVVSRVFQVQHMPEVMRGPALALMERDARAALLAAAPRSPDQDPVPS